MTTTTAAQIPTTAETPARIRYATPAVAIHEDADGYTIEAEMPGVTKDGVHVTVENGELAFTGTKSARPAGTRIYGEIAREDYRRVFDLDPDIDTAKIEAKMNQGLLTLRLPKAQEKKPRTISVTD